MHHLRFQSDGTLIRDGKAVAVDNGAGIYYRSAYCQCYDKIYVKIVMKVNIDSLPGTDFQRDVWRALTQIPRGSVRTYKQVAIMSGHPNSVRAVANAIGKNPCAPDIPCHRVIRSDGTIGGYSGVGGLDTKRKLLALEGIEIL